MRGLSVKRNRMTFDAKSSEHCAERQIQIQQHRPDLVLSDVSAASLESTVAGLPEIGGLFTGEGHAPSPLTDAEICDEVATFMLAGHETTANTMSWTLALLSAYPSARQQLEAEVDSVLGDRDPEAGDADKLPWTRAVVSEAMRLYPPAWTVERDAVQDDVVPFTRLLACITADHCAHASTYAVAKLSAQIQLPLAR